MVRDGKKLPQQISKYLDRNELREAGKKLIEAAKSENTKRAYQQFPMITRQFSLKLA